MTPTTQTRTTPTPTTQTTPASDRALARAISPARTADFARHHWERLPLHVAREARGRFHDLLTIADVERSAEQRELRHPGFRLVRADAQLTVGDYTRDIPWRPVPFTGSADPARVTAAIAEGATFVLQALHLTNPRVAAYCRELESWLGHPVQANAYFTPRRSQGLPVHHDTHDVFVLQAGGSKRWLVYEPVLELPLPDQRYHAELGEPGAVVLDVTLRDGDTLYLPRGWLHEALTSDDDSLHLAVGVKAYTWLDALHDAVDRCRTEPALRRAVPGNGSDGIGVLDRFARELESGAVARAMRDRFVRSRPPLLDDQLAQLRSLDELAPDSAVERRATVIGDLDGTTLRFEGKVVSFPAQARAELVALVTAPEPLRLDELPGRLDAAGRVTLARRLVREGFLRRLD